MKENKSMKKLEKEVVYIKQERHPSYLPLISVVIPCFNYGKYIKETIDSVLKQTYQRFEIIVVDDGSTDEFTIDTLKNLQTPKTRVFFQSNQTQAVARNNGIKKAKGKYICCLDADDLLKQDYLQKCISKIEIEGLDVCGTWLQEFGDTNEIWETKDLSIREIIDHNTQITASVFTKEIWNKAGGYKEGVEGYEDWEFWISVAELGGRGKVIQEPLFLYRKHGVTAINKAKEKHQQLLKKIQRLHTKLYKDKKYIDEIEKKENVERIVLNPFENLSSKEMTMGKDSYDILYSLETTIKYTNRMISDLKSEQQKLILENLDIKDQLYKIENTYSFKLLGLIRNKVLNKFTRPEKRWAFYHKLTTYFRARISNIKRVKENLTKKHQIYIQRPFPKEYPLVSVIIPCYNYGNYVEEAIDSVLNQTFQNFEIIVVNDGSTDPETVKILSSLKKPKTKILNQQNSRLPTARNNGINIAKGKYICCLDADDLLEPTFLEKCLVKMESNKLDVCGTWLQEFGDSNFIWQSRPLNIYEIKEQNTQIVSSVFTKKIWQKVGGYKTKMNYGYEDWEFWVSVSEVGGRGDIIPEPLFLYRKHGVSMINAAQDKHKALVNDIKELHPKIYNDKNLLRRLRQKQIVDYKVYDKYINLYNTEIKKPNVILFLPFLVNGGSDKRFQIITRYLIEHGFTVTIVSTLNQPETEVDTKTVYSQITNDIFMLRYFLQESDFYDFIKYLITSRQTSFVLLGGSEYAYKILKFIKKDFPHIKIIDQLFNTDVHFKSNLANNRYIDTTIAENQSIITEFKKHNRNHNSQVELIHNGIDLKQFPYIRQKKLDRSFTIAFIGRLSHEKGPDIFIEIVNSMKDIKNLRFILAGTGIEKNKCKKMITAYNLEKICEMPGNIDTKEYLKKIDLLIVPSRVDGRPNIILEAMSSGIPVIASNIGGIPDLLGKNSERGILVPKENVTRTKEEILKLMRNPTKLHSISKRARKYCEENLDDTKLLEKYLNILQG